MLCFPGRPLTTTHLGTVGAGSADSARGPPVDDQDPPYASIQGYIPPIQVRMHVYVCACLCVGACFVRACVHVCVSLDTHDPPLASFQV